MAYVPRRPLLRYGFAVLAVLLATILTLSIPSIVERAVFILFFVAVALSAWYWGRGPGLLATGLSVIASAYLLLPPTLTFTVVAIEVLRLGVFVFVALLISTLTTARKEAVRAEVRLAAIVESTDDAVIGKTLDGVITSWNAAAGRLYGYTAAEAVGQPVSILVPPDQPDEWPLFMERLRRGERIANYETVRRRKDGALLTVSLTISPTRDADGEIVGASTIARDLTERRRVQGALRQNQELLHRLTQNLPNGSINVFDRDLRYLLAEGQGLAQVGLTTERLVGKTLAEVFPREDVERVEPFYRRALAGETVEFELAYGGQWYSVNAAPLQDEAGHSYAIIAIALNITERKRLEAELREQAEVVEAVNRVGQLLSAELDQHKLVQAVTDAATELCDARCGSFFYNVLDERGLSYMRYALSCVPAGTLAHFPRLRAADLFGPTFRGEGTVRIADVTRDPRYGKNSPYYGVPPDRLPVTSYLAVPVVSRQGEVLGGLFFGHPAAGVFTERHERIVEGLAAQAAIAMDNARLFEAVQKARDQAEAANRMKDEFIATVSHELRTPLTAILGWTRILRTDGLDAQTTARALEVIERNAGAQSQLIEDLLDISRIVTGRLSLDVRPVVLAPVIEAVLDATRLAAEAKQIQLRAAREQQPCVVAGDAARLQQVVWNLVSNAIKFTPKGGRVEVRLACNDGHAEIAVSDTGAGISPDFLPYVFERFRQADQTTSRKYGGLGLGLAIVRHLVELHGGTVAATSAGEGQGATFTVRLPLTGLRNADFGLRNDREAGAQSPIPNPQSEILSGVRVLVVDDDADTRDYLTLVLARNGAEAQAVGSTAEALAQLRQTHPDALVSDIGMPGADGYELIRQVRAYDAARGARTPAVVVTAYARAEDRTNASAAGYDAYLAKPVEPDELVARLAALTGRTSKG